MQTATNFVGFLDGLCHDRDMIQRMHDKYGVSEQRDRHLVWCDIMYGLTLDSQLPRFGRLSPMDQEKTTRELTDAMAYGDSMGWAWPNPTYTRDWRDRCALAKEAVQTDAVSA